MLRARILSAVVLIPVVLILLILGPETTALTTGIAAIIGAYEFYHMSEHSPYHFHPLVIPGYIAAAAFSLAAYLKAPLWLLGIILLLAVLTLPYYWYSQRNQPATTPSSEAQPLGKYGSWLITIFAPVYVGLPLALIALIRRPSTDASIWWVVLICIGTWGADTGGYAFGRLFGRHKLAPKISPKKTWEGAVGGVLTAMIGVALVGGLALNIPLYLTLPLGFVLAVGSILGDLFESWAKRRFDTKDSGKLIPGHGGLLDRIDSFLVVTILTYIFILFYS
ncbi:MAG TPA: phosphatidate cytidylyltransferase [Chloroflexia bacterium]|nr:phosphatidate cytidylyltransferase [Chloroflexia bacterium]